MILVSVGHAVSPSVTDSSKTSMESIIAITVCALLAALTPGRMVYNLIAAWYAITIHEFRPTTESR